MLIILSQGRHHQVNFEIWFNLSYFDPPPSLPVYFCSKPTVCTIYIKIRHTVVRQWRESSLILSVIYSELYLPCNFGLSMLIIIPKTLLCLLTVVYCIFLILLSFVLPGNSPSLSCIIPSCWMKWILKHTKRLHISFFIYTDGFPLISELAVSQMSSFL